MLKTRIQILVYLNKRGNHELLVQFNQNQKTKSEMKMYMENKIIV